MATKNAIARHTLAEDLLHDIKVSRISVMFDELNKLSEEGKKDSAEWLEMWDSYKRLFKEIRGYTPHWVR